jgi:hypothetical protein
LDPAAVRWAVAFIVGWFVAWTGFVLYGENGLVSPLMQGTAFAVALGVLANFTITRSLNRNLEMDGEDDFGSLNSIEIHP